MARYNDEHPPAADNVSGADNVRVAIAATNEISACDESAEIGDPFGASTADDPADDPSVQEESS